ncbi:hypothetical protein [Deinococcus roseus]|uniref:Uncharacterized protein n=1 Tax=Deinococcus roseus TaxID=392414 RepID=A0ABQ2DHC4_9DEIO|nr:hypothetical protein [Deinococcus roseus]GGJ55641.1 hypothetical protein GCM10008938_47270 [Deinococcus roseus]
MSDNPPQSHPAPTPLGHIKEALAGTDWPLLAQQKATLVDIQDLEQDHHYSERLLGLVHWMDSLMDAAQADGFPVVFNPPEH